MKELEGRKLSPVAKELVDLILEHHLREQDVKKLAFHTIHEKYANQFSDKPSFVDYIVAQKNNKGACQNL